MSPEAVIMKEIKLSFDVDYLFENPNNIILSENDREVDIFSNEEMELEFSYSVITKTGQQIAFKY